MSQEQAITPVAAHNVTILGTKYPRALIIKGRLPGLNEYIAACNSAYAEGNRMKRESMDVVMWHILSQLRGVRFTKPVFIMFTYYEPNRRRDHDNVSSYARKAIQDALVKCGTLKDDSWGYVTGHMDFFEVDSKDPRIVVEFIEQEVTPACSKRPGKSSKK
jgi:Holliday junction resolvase RusA-like endonuclease